MTKTIIVDIDGTIADLSHRVSHVKDGNKQWKEFFDKMGDDLPIYPVIDVIEALVRLNDTEDDTSFFMFTGRPETHRKVTEGWVAQHAPALWAVVGSEMLLMRPEGDFRPDVVIKREMLDNIQGQGYNVVATFDDRQGVVDMWRAQGIACFQCAPGDFDTKPPVSPGTLHMMIGPSGAGKSRYAEYGLCDKDDQPLTAAIVSSDTLRAEINSGDIQNQTKNKQVFAALHAIVKARIENGLDTVVDATNLRNRDRKAIRDLVPRTCHIIYHVIDRALDAKWEDAGWRRDVVVHGSPLIDYHHHIFRSNLKDILAGDGDQRVDVIDHRPKDIK